MRLGWGVSLLLYPLGIVACGSSEDSPQPSGADASAGGPEGDVEAGAPAGDDAARAVALHEPGPYPVGVTHRVFIDESRPEEHTPDDPDDVRTLPSEIWYPAADSARDATKSPFVEFIGEESRQAAADLFAQGFGLTPDDVQTLFETPTGAVRDAPVAEGARFPVILFSHGNRATRWQMFQLTEHLASHGFIVIAPDHPYNAAATMLPSGPVTYSPESDTRWAVRVDDASFLLDAAADLDEADPEGLFTDAVDASRAGIMGQSLGGGTCLGALEQDDRFQAGACIVPAPTFTGPYEDPLLLVAGGRDETIPQDIVQGVYDEATGPRWLVVVSDAGHLSLTSQCLFQPESPMGCGAGFVDWDAALDVGRHYLSAFFGHHLGVGDYSDALEATPFSEATLTVDGFDGP